MILYIDSVDNTKTTIKIDEEEFTKEVTSPRDQNVFGFLVECLKNNNIEISQITEIKVNTGPGSFTGTRIGVTIANALAYSLKIKVNGQNPPVDVIYSSPPNITLPSTKSKIN